MAPRPIMEGRPWWPSGIAQSHDESVIYTKWGTTALHVPEISKEWWEGLENSWGRWPEITKLEKIEEDEIGIWLDLGDFIALVIPIPTGNHCSRLVKNSKLNKDISDIVDLPIAGCDKDGDHVLVYSKSRPTEISGENLAKLHTALIEGGWTTPNDQGTWNERLKTIEDVLKTNTLWRAPHSKNTIGIPKFNLKEMRVVPISISEKLIWSEDTNLPLLRQAVEYDVVRDYMQFIDSKYCDNSVMRTATGGLAHLKYDVNIFEKARSVAFSLDSKSVDFYLSKVDRFQAKLGIMRLLKMGIPLAISGLISTIWLARAGEFSNPEIGYITFAVIGIVSIITYRSQEPDWNQEL